MPIRKTRDSFNSVKKKNSTHWLVVVLNFIIFLAGRPRLDSSLPKHVAHDGRSSASSTAEHIAG